MIAGISADADWPQMPKNGWIPLIFFVDPGSTSTSSSSTILFHREMSHIALKNRDFRKLLQGPLNDCVMICSFPHPQNSFQ
jgi:hypothetical protein